MKNILFVCTGNSCRSVMAEGLFKKSVKSRNEEFKVGSAGIAALDGGPSSEETVRALKGEGIDMSKHAARRLTRQIAEEADQILVMEKMHKDMILDVWPDLAEKTRLLTDYATKDKSRPVLSDVPDPIRMSDDFYRQVLEMIRDCVTNLEKTL